MTRADRDFNRELSVRSLRSKHKRLKQRIAEMSQILPAWRSKTTQVINCYTRANAIASELSATIQRMASQASAEIDAGLRFAYTRWVAEKQSAPSLLDHLFGWEPPQYEWCSWWFEASGLPHTCRCRNKICYRTFTDMCARFIGVGSGNSSPNAIEQWSRFDRRDSPPCLILEKYMPNVLPTWRSQISSLPTLRANAFLRMKEAFPWRDFTEFYSLPSDHYISHFPRSKRTWHAAMEAWESYLHRDSWLNLAPLPDMDSVASAQRVTEMQEELTLLEDQIRQKEADDLVANAGQARTKAAAAAHFGKTRKLAAVVKERIRHQMDIVRECPYCGGVLGSEPQADHIYPVVRGGLSMPENMVYICGVCNNNKSDSTLREFVKTYGLSWERIEWRLDLLNKRY